MNLNGKIIVIDDDREDLEVIQEVFDIVIKKNNYTNEVITFNNGEDALEYLTATPESPFLIISDINMPRLNGFEIRRIIFDNPELRDKCVPYVFLTTSGDNTEFMKKSYELSVQGYFTKPNDYGEYEELLNDIVRYWKVAKIANRI